MDAPQLMKSTSENYKTLVDKLFSINLFGGAKFGLENMLRVAQAFGNPHNFFKSVHVAGTNGKGSVSLKIAEGLKKQGRTGLFTSPHISSFRERIQIDGKLIEEEEVVELLPPLFQHMPLTFFEITTLIAYLYFKDKVKWAVIETGLGGRLDATNIITPELSVITSISLEHTEILGSTIDEIAFEKGGIIKNGVPLILGPRTPPILEKMAREKQAPCIKVKGLFKNYDEENSAIAKAALDFLKAPTDKLSIRPRCRFEIHGNTVLDVAHNPDGMKELLKMLDQHFGSESFHFVIALSKTKDIKSCLEILKPKARSFTFTEASNGRSEPAENLSRLIPGSTYYKEVKDAIFPREGITVITGSFFIMRDALLALGQKIEQDPYDMNERSLPK